MATEARQATEVVDLATTPLRELNQRLHDLASTPGSQSWRVVNPNGAHAVAAGLDADVEVEIEGHVGYYCAGMNKVATVRVHGNAGPGLAENMMSGRVIVDGNASQSAGATGRGGLLVVHGDAAARCGISMK
ncbi:MAG: protein GlxC, partial [Gaiellaceae bacterium]